MRKREAFNEVAELYDRVRPRYPAELFDDLAELAELPDHGRILEVGAGTGIATLPLAERGYEIVAVELGSDLAAVARRRLATFANVEVVVGAFEEWQLPDEPFDLVMSGTAWHWIDRAVGYRKAADALHGGGAFAIFSYKHVAGGDRDFFELSQPCYERYTPDHDPDFRLPEPEEVEPDTKELIGSGLFEAPVVRGYLTEETYSREEYADLLSTYSNHRALDEATRREFLDCIGSLIDGSFGGKVRKRYLNELVLATRKS